MVNDDINITKLYTKYIDFIDLTFPIGGIIRRFPYVLIFKTTNYCWYKCLHCCENSGPDQQKHYIPRNIIKDYISKALEDSSFSKEVVFTGGEIMSSYLFYESNYVPDLLNFCCDRGVGVDIKTNGDWVNTDLGKRIFHDLTESISNGKPYGIQISLSLDKFHKNSMENCVKIIKELYKYKDMHTVVHLSSFKGDEYLYIALCMLLKKEGVRFDKVILKNGRIVDIVGDKLILLQSSDATLFSGGRAKNLAEAMKVENSQFNFLSENNNILMAFDSFGNVTLGENSGKKIKTEWTTNKNVVRSLHDIKKSLISKAHLEEILFELHRRKR